ncbi:CRISPR-associated helicase Cas3' [Clostridium saccharobutylicum]|uniref:CRISPR-associated helicase Cas3' n=1 Tax=Clostridium saccharobutylicum TaxID=169679 RepID=UPI0030FED16F
MIDISTLLKEPSDIYSHTKSDILEYETLAEHNERCIKYFYKIVDVKNLDSVFNNFEQRLLKGCSSKCINLWKEIVLNTVFFHDVGKSNPGFQKEKMKNEKYKNIKVNNSNHSRASGIVFFNHYYNEVFAVNNDEAKVLFVFLCLSMYVINKHHSSLEDLAKNLQSINKDLKTPEKNMFANIIKDLNNFDEISDINELHYAFRHELESNTEWISLDMYIYTRFLYSLLVASDFYATSEYMTGAKIEHFGIIDDTKDYRTCLDNSAVGKCIGKYKDFKSGLCTNPYGICKGDMLNQLRTEIYLEADFNIDNNINADIFFLPAPTGAGKTNISINLALKLIENNPLLNKISYNFPFNNLVEQTKNSLYETFNENKKIKESISVINSITPIKEFSSTNDNDEVDFNKSLLSRQFLHYPVIVSTHVGLFDILFGINKENLFPLVHLCNSVIILDEIQAYKNSIWKEIIIFLKTYAKLLNIKFIIMSATLPDLTKLCNTNDGFISLIEDNSKYFTNPLFKDRVDIDYKMLNIDKENLFKALILKVIEVSKLLKKQADKFDNKILVEFITKSAAKDFYENLSTKVKDIHSNEEIILFTGDDSSIERKKIINHIKSSKNIILISTQVIEAGVDIDMDIGFKDISMLDSDEQFVGRINRNCKKENCKVYFFNYDDVTKIYKNDIRNSADYSLLSTKMRELFELKKFDIYYDYIINELNEAADSKNAKNIDFFRKNTLTDLEFYNIKKRMKLIDDQSKITIFLNINVEDENGNIFIGENVWNKYLSLLKNFDITYQEKQVELSKIREKVQYFTYEINDKYKGKFSYDIDKSIGNTFYINNGDDYITNGKFDRDKLINDLFS